MSGAPPPVTGASNSTSSSLLSRARAHDERAWTRLVDLYGPLVYHWCRRAGLRAEDSADLVQDVFRSVYSGLPRFRQDRPGDTFRGWLWTISRNKLRDHARGRVRRPEAAGGSDAHEQFLQIPDQEPSDDGSSVGGAAVGGLASRALELIRGDIEERTWRAFTMSALDGRSAAAIAVELKMTANSVRNAKARVLRRLREEFGDLL